MPILSLLAKLGLDISGFQTGLASASKEADKFGDSFSKRLGKGFTGGAIAAGLLSLVRGAVDAGGEIDELAKKLNITSELAQKLRLEDKLKSGIGKGNVFLDDEDLENLRLVERTLIKIWTIGQNLAAKQMKMFGSIPGELTKFAKLIGFVSGGPPQDQPSSELFAQDRKRRAVELGNVFNIEKQAAEQNAKNELARLTDGQKFNRLLTERAELLKFIKQQEGLGPLDMDATIQLASAKLRAANIQADIISSHRTISPIPNDLGRIGAFSGATAQAALPRLAREQVQELKTISRQLRTGVPIKDIVP